MTRHPCLFRSIGISRQHLFIYLLAVARILGRIFSLNETSVDQPVARTLIEGIHQLHHLSPYQRIVSVHVENNTALLAMAGDGQKLVPKGPNTLIVLDQGRPRPQSWEGGNFPLQDLGAVIGGCVIDEKESVVGVILVFDRLQEFQVEVVGEEISPGGNEANRQFFFIFSD